MHSRRSLLLPAIILAAAISGQASNFGPFSCSTCGSGFDASAFNVVTLGTSSDITTGNFNPSSDVGGGVAVFGNYTGNGYQIGSQLTTVPNPYSDAYTMIVNGSISTNPFTVGSGSGSQAVWVGGTHGSFNSPQPTVSQSPSALDFDFLAARTSLDNLSTNTLATYTAVTGTPVSNGTNYVLTATGTGLLVYNINASYFTNQNLGFQVNAVTGQSVVINIVGASSSFSFSKGTVIYYNNNLVTANTTGGVPVLFNLPEVTGTLGSSNGSINGTILAPYATFGSNQTVDGQLFVASVSSLAETHDQYYDGLLPSLGSVATPEPASFLLFGGALIALGMLGKNERARNR
jgi:choice-of-anchor A domain-containing protein